MPLWHIDILTNQEKQEDLYSIGQTLTQRDAGTRAETASRTGKTNQWVSNGSWCQTTVRYGATAYRKARGMFPCSPVGTSQVVSHLDQATCPRAPMIHPEPLVQVPGNQCKGGWTPHLIEVKRDCPYCNSFRPTWMLHVIIIVVISR